MVKPSKKRKNSSNGSSTQSKNARNGGSPVNVSDTLHQANSVLYGNDSDGSISDLDLNDTVFEKSISGEMSANNDDGGKTVAGPSKGEGTPPSNSDILQYLKQMDKKFIS